MSKTTALTFTAAFLLLAACVMTSVYAPRNSARYEQEAFIIYDGYDSSLETWERATQLTGLLAISLSIAGALLWNRETQPQAKQATILGLNEMSPGRMLRATAPQQTIVAAKPHIDGMIAPAQEEESLTPLERVIRGY
jgi:cbb3-type cytochrome oxidase subunit 3